MKRLCCIMIAIIILMSSMLVASPALAQTEQGNKEEVDVSKKGGSENITASQVYPVNTEPMEELDRLVKMLEEAERKNDKELIEALLKEAERKKELKEIKGGATSASWGNQIRSYVLHPYKLVKDLRTNVEAKNVEEVLDGNIDVFIEAEIKYDINTKHK